MQVSGWGISRAALRVMLLHLAPHLLWLLLWLLQHLLLASV
jgi:hypothetical protein